MGGGILSTFGLMFVFLIYIIKGTPDLNAGAWNVISWLSLVTIVFYIALMFFINWRVIVDGANDNLSACFVSIGI